MLQLQFFGATNTVTGSKTLVQAMGKRLLVDCGLFQGFKQLRLKNWGVPPFVPRELDAVLLTHAHLDHSGYLPVLVKRGFAGPVYCTKASQELCKILLRDAGHLQEEEAAYANRHAFSKHHPALPLYTVQEAEYAAKQLKSVSFLEPLTLGAGLSARWTPNGHILGSGCISLTAGKTTVMFSGDVGRPNDPIMRAPTPMDGADYLVLESTYGDRRHEATNPETMLRDVINRTGRRGGSVVIPAFAVGRAQTLLYLLYRLKQRREIIDMPIYLNSPMACDVTELYREFADQHRLLEADYRGMFKMTKFVNTADESRALVATHAPMIVISASGMASGGRVLHHLKQMAPDPKNTILFAGHQAGGTRGAAMLAGVPSIKIHGEYIPVRAEVVNIESMSAHADYAELLDWLATFKRPPKRVFLNHGEPAAQDALRLRIKDTLGWDCHAPEYGEAFELN